MTPNNATPPSNWLAGIFASSRVAIGISRLADKRFVAVSNAFRRLFGYRRGEPVCACMAAFRKRSGAIGDLRIAARILLPSPARTTWAAC